MYATCCTPFTYLLFLLHTGISSTATECCFDSCLTICATASWLFRSLSVSCDVWNARPTTSACLDCPDRSVSCAVAVRRTGRPNTKYRPPWRTPAPPWGTSSIPWKTLDRPVRPQTALEDPSVILNDAMPRWRILNRAGGPHTTLEDPRRY